MPLHRRHPARRAGLRRATVLAVLATVAAGLGPAALDAPARADDTGVPALQLVTLTGPGTSAGGRGPADLLARQDAVLAQVGSPMTTYRWTTALNGFAAELTPEQVAAVQADPEVASVEANTVRALTGRRGTALASGQVGQPRSRGGAGAVIGVIDSGLAPESPLFAALPGLGRAPEDFDGTCEVGEEWSSGTCSRKVVASGWWVAGFGQDRIRASEHLSPRDAIGHGTQVASVAAGNAGVSVRMQGRTVGQYGGIAPQARIAAYKACWGAPDPGDDGCATADLVSAIDRATADGVDVLNLSVAGPPGTDTVERALLGAAEADVVVVAAAGNDGRRQYAAHDSPWVTTVGASLGSVWQGRVSVAGGPTLTGASRSRRTSGPTRLVLGADVAAPGVRRRDAAQCRPGTLDAARTAGRAVFCERGGIGRIDKSDAVARADGVAMVLGNVRPGPVVDDFHAVPTVQLAAPDAARLLRWIRTHDRTTVRMSGVAPSPAAGRTAAWSPSGDPRASAVKPDVVAVGDGVLGAVPGDRGWALFSGTSAATARVSGAAALLRSRHDWPAPVVRSVLATTAAPLGSDPVLRQGAGRAGADVTGARLALPVATSGYREALDTGSWADLNLSSVLVRGNGTVTRRVTNLGTRAEYFSAQALGFARHRVRVTPLAVRLGPGETATFRIAVTGPAAPGRVDDGWIRWRGARGSVTRIPVAITR
ncbi:S8 family serine peptidase [Nocardioides sp. Soil805]|uniref:S8 family serine peptidase n=1 Tax=Nocardioides sp. Soil805 TaxID=1736416 RepID=UPI000702BADF|nr:S8 family serine peptidase [Nocardioides sp. Soil805]KRF35176.1 hypothetical protein ASG94_13755 [Nocardioides sp. Soil805]